MHHVTASLRHALALFTVILVLNACQAGRTTTSGLGGADGSGNGGGDLLGGFNGSGADFDGTGSVGGSGTGSSGGSSGTGSGQSGLSFNTRISGGALPLGTIPSPEAIEAIFHYLGIAVPPSPFPVSPAPIFACFDVNVAPGANGDTACRAAGSTCTRVIGNSGNQSLYCSTSTLAGDNVGNSRWLARCCQDLSSIYSYDPTGGLECVEAQVAPGLNGHATCESQASACFGVVGTSGKQSAYCGTIIKNGAGTQNPFWLARCCRNRRPTGMEVPSCQDFPVGLTSNGEAVCAQQDKRCISVVASHGNQSLYCGTNPAAGNNSRNPTWFARCCK